MIMLQRMKIYNRIWFVGLLHPLQRVKFDMIKYLLQSKIFLTKDSNILPFLNTSNTSQLDYLTIRVDILLEQMRTSKLQNMIINVG